jgi:UDP-N-acetylmuramoylalanine--D-glutamate ligase
MRVIRISSGTKLTGPGWNVFARKGFLSETRKGRQVASIDLRDTEGLPGAHNHQNAAAAYAALRALGMGPRPIEVAFKSFKGLPHRSQLVGIKDGVAFVNDSKATNVESAAKALAAFDGIRWIVGGQVKDGGLGDLREAKDHVRKAYVIGRQADEVSLELTDFEVEICRTMDVAVSRAISDAKAGDTVLLAPAAASFDQYDNFEDRGDHFITEVMRHLE